RESWTRQTGVYSAGPVVGGWPLGGIGEPRPAACATSSAPSMVNSARVRPNPMMSRFIVDPPRWGVFTWRFIVDPPRRFPFSSGWHWEQPEGQVRNGRGRHPLVAPNRHETRGNPPSAVPPPGRLAGPGQARGG